MPGTWSVEGNLITVRYALIGAGTQTAGLCMGGWGSSDNSSVTKEYIIGHPAIKRFGGVLFVALRKGIWCL